MKKIGKNRKIYPTAEELSGGRTSSSVENGVITLGGTVYESEDSGAEQEEVGRIEDTVTAAYPVTAAEGGKNAEAVNVPEGGKAAEAVNVPEGKKSAVSENAADAITAADTDSRKSGCIDINAGTPAEKETEDIVGESAGFVSEAAAENAEISDAVEGTETSGAENVPASADDTETAGMSDASETATAEKTSAETDEASASVSSATAVSPETASAATDTEAEPEDSGAAKTDNTKSGKKAKKSKAAKAKKVHHKGRITQIPIYLGKFFRMFIYMDDWKVIPMAAIIATLVALVACSGMFQTMEGTYKGSLALVCVCIWNGMFNSVQVVCRERDIIKREHRSGMHILSYVSAHMIYQAFLCLLQTLVTIGICRVAKVQIPAQGFITPWGYLDMCITFFLTTYAADMMSLFVSCLVKNTTAAMTVMPFILIFQLIFSGGMFTLTGIAQTVSVFTISKWGMNSICAIGNYNSLPAVSLWNQLFAYRDYEIQGMYPIRAVVDTISDRNLIDAFCQEAAKNNIKPEYATTLQNVFRCWGVLILFALVFAFLAMVLLKRIDKDKR